MYGPGTGPPPVRPPHRGAVIGLRVLFTVLPVVTLGVGAWGSVLRLAMLRRQAVDWALLPVVAVFGIGGFVLIGSSSDDSPQSNVGAVGIFACMLAVPVYYLVADLLWHTRPQQQAMPPRTANPYATGPVTGPLPGPLPGPMNGPLAGTGHAPVPGPISGPPHHGMTGGLPYASGTPAPQPTRPPVAGTGPAHPRIDQVRAELDELSDYLRKEDGR
ncbi:hypothetical protein [Streptomyces sp. NPDC020917]|uniref:hypothetical protein n=1 Tax=Streptomyces sp. NPDC020917 TaxID=3365102 RepID=UPI0037966AE3